MPIVALTGGIGSGKSVASEVFQSLNVPLVDLDVIAHQLTSAGSALNAKISQQFGSEYLTQDGALNRSLMRDLVFKDAQAREKLNGILHPMIYQEAVAQLAKHADAVYQVLAVPLLVESVQYRALVNHVLLIDCEESAQIKRVMQRNQFTEEEAKRMLAAQSSRKSRIAIADTIILNDGKVQDLQKKIIEFHENYINTCIVSKLI